MNIEETLKPKLKYEKYLNNQICPECNSKEIGFIIVKIATIHLNYVK